MKTIFHYKQKAAQAVGFGQLKEAESWLQKARELAPSDTDVWQLSVQVNGQLGDIQTAAACCEQLLTLKPEDGAAWGFLGTARLAAGRHQDAIEAFDKALALAPDTPMMLINRGCALLQLDKLEEAIDSIGRAVQLAPDNANAHFNLARAYKSQGRIKDAIQELKTTIELNPDLVVAHTSLANLLVLKGSLQESRRVWLNALNTYPDQVEYRFGLAKSYAISGDYDGALEQYEKIRLAQPDSAQALCGQADVLERKGELDKAFDIVRQLLSRGVKDITLAAVFGRLCHRYDSCDEAVDYLLALLDSRSTDEELSNLHFSLGNVYDRIGCYDDAFMHFEKANRLTRYHCEMEEVRQRFRVLRECFSRENVKTLPRSSNMSERPVFIVGMPRSGTTLVEQIIASHPDAYGAGELPDVQRMADSMPSLCGPGAPDFPGSMHSMDVDKMNKMASAYLRSLEEYNSDCKRVVDKMPHNFQYAGLICLLFPGARIIHCRREPADTCLSIFTKPFISLHAYGTNLGTLGQYYREYQKLMDHWREVFPGRLFEINYEDLVSDQEQYSRALIEYCGLEWDERCLAFYDSDRAVVTASYAQVRRPIYSSSSGRWRNYEKHLQPLLQGLNS